MMAVYRGEVPASIPITIYNRYLPRGACERELRNRGLGVIDYVPPVSLIAPPWHMLPGYVSRVKDVDLRIQYGWEDGHPVEIRTYETPVGAVFQKSRKDPAYGSDWIVKHYATRPEDYRVLQYLVEHTVLHRNEDRIREGIENLGADGVLWGRMDRSPFQKLLIELAGPQQFLLDLCTDPGPIEELMAAMEAKMQEAFDLALESRVEAIWQPDNITADTTPPAFFGKYCSPFYRKRGERCRQAGKPYLVHMDGRLGPLAGLIAGCPFDAVESFSLPQMGGDLPLAEAKTAWPEKAILPNFPASLCYQPRERILEWMRQLASEATGVPLALQFSEDIPTEQWQRVLRIACGIKEEP